MLTLKFNKKTAVFVVIMIALVLVGIVLLAGAHHAAQEQSTQNVTTVKNDKTRAAYLAQYGWEVETPAQSQDTVLIPREFSQVFESYNELQKQQGFDLSQYCGLEVELYTYKVLNAQCDDTVLAQLYVLRGSVIGGDVHSTALDGFMTGIKPGRDAA